MKFKVNNEIITIKEGQYWIQKKYDDHKYDNKFFFFSSIFNCAIIIKSIIFLNKNLQDKSIIYIYERDGVKIIFNYLSEDDIVIKHECMPDIIFAFFRPATEKEINELNIMDIIA